MRNRIWAFLLTVLLILGSIRFPVRADEGEVIIIQSMEDYRAFAKACALDSWSEGKSVRLETDLEFTNVNEIALIPYFQGAFDGQGHTVSGLTVYHDGSVQGLFRYIGEGGTVSNLHVIGTVSPEGSGVSVGGIAGENRGLITNCTFSGVVRGSSTVGGIAGNNEETGVIAGCRITGIVRGDHYAGGIAGKNSGTIENCVNKGNINTSAEEAVLNLEYMNLDSLRSTENRMDITDIGGIAGYSDGRIQSCTNNGRVGYQHVGYNVGGIAGRQCGYVNNCANYGTVYGRKDIGGINGQMEPYNTLIFSESTLSKLDGQLDELQARIDRLIGDADDLSDTVTGKLSDMRESTVNAQSSVETMLSQIENVVNADTDTLNELSERISDTIEKLTPSSMELTDASSRMKAAVRHLQEAAEHVGDAADISQEGMDWVNRALSDMQDAQADFERAAEPLDEAGKSFNMAVGYFAEAAKLIQEGAAKEEIEEKAKQGTDTFKEGMDALSVAGKCIRSGMEDVTDALSAVRNAIPYFEDTRYPIGDALRETEDSLDDIYRMSSSLTEALAGAERAMQDLAEKEGLSFTKLEEDFDSSREALSASVTEISDILDFVNSTVSEKNSRIGDDIQSVSDQIFAITETIGEAFREDEEDKEYVEDISDEDTGEQTEGKTAACINYGVVEGDVNIGGITGSMAIEYDFDPEDDIKTEGDASRNFIYQTRAVIRSCKNEGEITGKKNAVGGIVGSMDLGSVIDCCAYGSVTSTGGRYTGGIAGYSAAYIRDSFAKCRLSGKDYVGGIAGLGNHIRQCRSLVKIEEGNEYIGAVAGRADGNLADNYFVSDTVAGVDGVSYAVQAEPMDYADFAALEGLPEEFLSFRLSFLAGDETVYETEFAYGDDLSDMRLPEIPGKDGYYAVWEDTEYSRMVFDTIVEAVYKDNITALESAQKRAELPVLLVEGNFSGDQRLSLNAGEDASGMAQREELLECWKLAIPEDGNTSHRIQYLIPEGEDDVKIECMVSGGWTEQDTVLDGRYLIWETDGNDLVFRSVRQFSYLPFVIAGAGVAAAAVLIAAVLIVRKRKKKARKAEPEEENAGTEKEKEGRSD